MPLSKENPSVLQLAEPFELSQPAISKHLKVLERTALISRVVMRSADRVDSMAGG